MGQYLEIHKDNPQARLISQAATILRRGGVIVYPTDSCYALACHIGDKTAMDRIIRLRQLGERHNMTLICRDLSEISSFAKVGNAEFRLIKSLTPGPYTFLLKATRDVPKRLQHPKRKTIGIRIPDNKIAQDLLDSLGEPLLSTSLILPGDEFPMNEPDEIEQRLIKEVDLVIDGGHGGISETTVLDLTMDEPHVVREGLGEISNLLDLD
ncbi:MAG: threonylcarbamoyl-AMP synthase [Gammaproteobacteria bacterium]|jgi:tRNA threonylcarbamoyl adenosine modification protein (Sua5/YciO/YrdC/YwlC family)|nr:threonylcarbamoyl-AMP synthase [Gammaproteobacteria bacterium]